jgi:hypothetical protein
MVWLCTVWTVLAGTLRFTFQKIRYWFYNAWASEEPVWKVMVSFPVFCIIKVSLLSFFSMGVRLVRSNFLLLSHATFLSFLRSQSTSAARNSHFDVSWHRLSFSPHRRYYYTPFSYLPASSTSRRGLKGSDASISLCGVLGFLLSDKLLSISTSHSPLGKCVYISHTGFEAPLWYL